MENNDRQEFVCMLAAVYALHRAEFSDGVTELWWAVLQGFELAAVREALTRCLMSPDTGQFLPKPADVVREIGGTTQDKSMLAWAKVIQGLRQFGTYESVQFDDPIIHRVLVDLGGWTWLGDQLEKEMPFVEKRFRDAYRAWLHRGLTGWAPAHLAGRIEMSNCAIGFHDQIPEPKFIGVRPGKLLEAKCS